MSNSRKLIVEVIGDTSKLDKSFRETESRAKGLGRKVKTFGAIGVGLAGAAVVKGLQMSVNAALDAEKAQLRLSGAFKQAGVSQAQAAKANERIAKVSREAALDDEALSDSLAKLTRTTGSAAKGLKGMALAANIARARGISLEAATKIVEKASIGQLRGLKAVGVQIGDNTTITEALERAQRKFAGSAEQYGRSASGAQDRLGVAFENLQEKIGEKLLPVLADLSVKLVELIEWSEKNWPRFSKAVTDMYKKMRPVIRLVVAQIKTIGEVIEGVVKIVRGIANGEWGQVWDGIKQVVENAVIGTVRALTALPRLILRSLSRAAFKGLERVGQWIGDALTAGVKGVLSKVIALINKVVRGINRVSGAVSRVVPGNLPKVPEIDPVDGKPKPGGSTKPAPTPTRPQRGVPSRRTSSLAFGGDGVIVVETTTNLHVDGQRLASAVTRGQQRARRNNPRQKRGPNS